MGMGTSGKTPNPKKDEPCSEELAPVDDPNVSMAELTEEDREIRLQRVREQHLAFPPETR